MLNHDERVLDAKLVVAIVACGIMSFSGVVVETAMNVAFPTLMSEFSVDTATVQWVTTAYLLVLTCIMPVSSLLKRRFRTKSLFVAAIALFIAGTVSCAAAPAFPALVAGRVVQGVGTGIALPLMFNIILEQAPYDRIGMMMGFGTLITALAPAVGPSLGGFIIGLWGWRMVFVVLLPFLAASAVGGIWSIRQASQLERVKFSVAQFASLAGSFACLIFAMNAMSGYGPASVQFLGLLAAFALLLAAYCALSIRSESPLVRIDVFRSRRFTLCVAYLFLLQAIVLALGYLLPYYGQEYLGLSEFMGGCLLLPGCLIGAAMAPMGGRILDRLGGARPLLAGAAIQLAAMVLFWLFGYGDSATTLWTLYLLVPIAQGLSASNSITFGIRQLPEDRTTDGNAVFNTLQQLGGAVGTAVTTSIVNMAQTAAGSNLAAGTSAGAHEAAIAMLAASAVAFICMAAVFAKRRESK